MVGIEDWEPSERVARLAEYVQIVDGLLRDEVTSFARASSTGSTARS